MKKKQILILLLAVLLLVAAIAAFFGKEKKNESSPAETSSAAMTTAAPTHAPATQPQTASVPTEASSTAVPVQPSTEPETPPAETSEPIVFPDALDYGQPENWAYFGLGEDRTVDVFLICPTVDTRSEMNAYDLNTKLKERFVNALEMERGIYEETARMYSPYYRQMSIKAYSLPAEDYEKAKQIAYRDISEAFRWYLDHENKGRALILAGFSQGAEMCLELMKEYFSGDSAEAIWLRRQLITVYAIGWSLTEETVKAYPAIVPAAGEKDTGTVVCFDCEDGSLTETVIIPDRTFSINPLNWKTDDTPADKSLNLGAVMSTGAEPVPGLCGAVIGPRGELIVTDIKTEDYPPGLDILPAGAFHIYDYLFYFTNLKQNIAVRTEAWQTAPKPAK